MFYEDRIWNYLRKYVEDRVIAYSYCASPDRMVFLRYRPDSIKQGIKGKPYMNLSRKEFDDIYFEMFDWEEITSGLPAEKVTGIHASLSRFSCREPPVIEKDFYGGMLPHLKSRDLGYDFDTGIKNISQLNRDSLERYGSIVQLVWDSLKDSGLKPSLKLSGSGFHIVAPIRAPDSDKGIAETVTVVSRYVAELGLSDIPDCKFQQNKFYIPNKKYPLNVEVQKDLNRLFSIPFSPYTKRHKTKNTKFENKVLLCIPLKEPSELLDFSLEKATPGNIDEIEIPKYPESVRIRESLMNEALEHYEKLERRKQKTYSMSYSGNEKSEVSVDNLPPSYKHLERGVSEGSRDNSVTQLVGVFKTCGLSEHETLTNMLRFNHKCRPPLTESIVVEKVRRLYRK